MIFSYALLSGGWGMGADNVKNHSQFVAFWTCSCNAEQLNNSVTADHICKEFELTSKPEKKCQP